MSSPADANAFIVSDKIQNFSILKIMFCVKLGNCNAFPKDKHPRFTSAYEDSQISWRCLDWLPQRALATGADESAFLNPSLPANGAAVAFGGLGFSHT